MRVRVTAPAFCDYSRIDEKGFLELGEGATLNDLYKKLKIPLFLRPILITSVNYDLARPSAVLSDRDEVSILWLISGG